MATFWILVLPLAISSVSALTPGEISAVAALQEHAPGRLPLGLLPSEVCSDVQFADMFSCNANYSIVSVYVRFLTSFCSERARRESATAPFRSPVVLSNLGGGQFRTITSERSFTLDFPEFYQLVELRSLSVQARSLLECVPQNIHLFPNLVDLYVSNLFTSERAI